MDHIDRLDRQTNGQIRQTYQTDCSDRWNRQIRQTDVTDKIYKWPADRFFRKKPFRGSEKQREILNSQNHKKTERQAYVWDKTDRD